MKYKLGVVYLVLVAMCISFPLKAQWLDDSRNERKNEEAEQSGIDGFYKWFYSTRSSGLGYIPSDAYSKATAVKSQLAIASSQKVHPLSGGNDPLAAVVWKNIGPYNISTDLGGPHGGRINTIVTHPTDPNIAYFGGANGGVWKTINGGTSWFPTSDFSQSLAMGALAIDPKNPSIIYAGTGEYAQGYGSFYGGGILRSTDAGGSWHLIGLTNVGAFSRLFVNTNNSDIIYAAAAGSGSGLYITKDAGVTWNRVPTSTGLPAGSITDLQYVRQGSTDVLYAAIASHGVYRSDDNGNFWTPIEAFTQMRRMHVAVDPKNANDVVVLSIGYDGNFEALTRSTDGGSNWQDISDAFQGAGNDPFSVAGSYQGWYDAYLLRDPNNSDHFFLAGISIFSTDDGGQSWSDVGGAYAGGIHPDQHAAAFAADGKLFIGCDGGIAISGDNGDTFDVADDSTAITESYGMAIDQTVDDQTYIGTQDNGTLVGTSSAAWEVIGGGDGGTVVVDSKDANRVYFIRPTAFSVSLFTNGFEQSFNSGINGGDSAGWVKPFVQDEKNHILYTGSQFFYFMPDGSTTWTRRSKKLASGAGVFIAAIGPAGDGQSVMVGTTDGKMWSSTNNGSAWKAVNGLPGRSINDILVSPASQQTFYVCLSGFGDGHVFKTTDFGGTWTNISGKLPDISANKLVIDPEHPTHLYLATDVGIFYSPNDGADWLPYGTGFPNVAAFDMQLHHNKNVLRVATHGRSVWEAPLAEVASGITNPTVTTIWHVGEAASINWYGTTGNATVEISVDGGKNWITLSTTATASFSFDSVRFSPSNECYVRVSSGSEVLLSKQFRILQRRAGTTFSVFTEQPLYMYDLAYDADDNVLWVTNFSDADPKIYKMDPNTGQIIGNISVSGGGAFTGIKYDKETSHLFACQTPSTGGQPYIFEINKQTGARINRWAAPQGTTYATGILIIGDTLLFADRDHNVIHRVHKSNPNTPYDNFDLTATRTAAFGPRCLALNTKTGDLLHTWTDFQGTQASATLYDSYILKLSRYDGAELSSWFVQEGDNNGTNVRGIEYDPHSDGKEVWVTVLNSGNSSKILKLTLVDGPASLDTTNMAVRMGSSLAQIQAYPNPVHGQLTVQYTLGLTSSATRIVVTDVLGREMVTTSYSLEEAGSHGHRLDLSSLASGGYTVAIYDGQTLIGKTPIVIY